MKTHRQKIFERAGSALVMTLVIIVLISVIVTGYLANALLEAKNAGSALDHQKAYAMAIYGKDAAVAEIRDALGPWDNPFQNFTNAPPFYWSVSPGLITRWSYGSTTALTNYPLFSQSTTTNLVNLNRQTADGTYPIIGGTNPPGISVKWVNVLRDPTSPASSVNPVVGRYAFWVDDESAKININTADGTQKYLTNSYGLGMPTEVSLQAIQQGGTNISANVASNMVAVARTNGFKSVSDLAAVSGVTTNLPSDNIFSLTTCSRAPEVNLFGEPKMFLIPAFVSSLSSFYIATNGITRQPLTELYPTPSQLPGFTAKFRIMAGTATNIFTASTTNAWNGVVAGTTGRPWPMVFGQWNPTDDLCNSQNIYQWNSIGFNDALICKYLSGTNGKGSPIQWPALAGTSQPAAGFTGKYSLRQLDSIAMQISDLVGKSISPEMGNSSWVSSSAGLESYVYSVPTTTWGYLSGQLVSGMGRYPKTDEILINVTAFSGTKPYALFSTYVECAFPAGYAGVDLMNASPSTSGFHSMGNTAMVFGDSTRSGHLNIQDMPSGPGGTYTNYPMTVGSPIQTNVFWQDSLLHNDAGIDFFGNPGTNTTKGVAVLDPDQQRAAIYHPYDLIAGTNYCGSGTSVTYADAFKMEDIEDSSNKPWIPGQYRSFASVFQSTHYLMKPGTANIQFSGGINVLSYASRGDPDPVPLDAVRGIYDGESVTNAGLGQVVAPMNIVTNAVIAVNFTVPVQGSVASWHAEVADPLVNKFPGDWVGSVSVANTMGGTLPAAKSYSVYTNGANSLAMSQTNYDPDSFWMPPINNSIQRSARLPNIGYLQYIRTGIIPDSESVPYSTQHGTPYRLLSFAPSTTASVQETTSGSSASYPDWAMLDLFTVPSPLKPYGTFGGATYGRLNPNGAVVYTTNANIPTPGISRTLPLQAVFYGLQVNQTYGSGTTLSGGSAVDATSIAQAICNYLTTNGPLKLSGEICNVPEISALAAPNNPTRNDLVRQVIGNLSTQSNVFSVWVAGQSVQKVPWNKGYGAFETGDNVLGEVRYHFIVERYLDPGADGVYGNSASPGNDGVVGTWDDLMDPTNHPFEPRYLYRVVYSEEVRG